MRYLLSMVIATLIGMAPAVQAADADYRQITGAHLKALFLDKTVIGEYQDIDDGIKHYRFSEHHFSDGTTDYIERGQKVEKGRWNIVGKDKICYRYPGNEVFNKTYCFFVFKIDHCYYNYGLGAMTLRGPKNTDWWTSRFVVKGEGGSCEAAVG